MAVCGMLVAIPHRCYDGWVSQDGGHMVMVSSPIREEMNNSNLTHSTNMHPPLTVLKPSLISRINIETNSCNITNPSLHPTALELKQWVDEVKEVRRRVENLEKNLISAIISIEQMDVVWPLKNANTNTSVKNAKCMDMESWSAKSRRQCEELGKRPRYLRYNVFWDDNIVVGWLPQEELKEPWIHLLHKKK